MNLRLKHTLNKTQTIISLLRANYRVWRLSPRPCVVFVLLFMTDCYLHSHSKCLLHEELHNKLIKIWYITYIHYEHISCCSTIFISVVSVCVTTMSLPINGHHLLCNCILVDGFSSNCQIYFRMIELWWLIQHDKAVPCVNYTVGEEVFSKIKFIFLFLNFSYCGLWWCSYSIKDSICRFLIKDSG